MMSKTSPKFSEGEMVIAVFSDKERIMVRVVDSYVYRSWGDLKNGTSGTHRYYAVDPEGQEIPPTTYYMNTAFGDFPAISEFYIEKCWIHDTKLGKLL